MCTCLSLDYFFWLSWRHLELNMRTEFIIVFDVPYLSNWQLPVPLPETFESFLIPLFLTYQVLIVTISCNFCVLTLRSVCFFSSSLPPSWWQLWTYLWLLKYFLRIFWINIIAHSPKLKRYIKDVTVKKKKNASNTVSQLFSSCYQAPTDKRFIGYLPIWTHIQAYCLFFFFYLTNEIIFIVYKLLKCFVNFAACCMKILVVLVFESCSLSFR